MTTESPFPQVEAAVVLIERARLYLAEYNPRWQTYTLPMARPKKGIAGGTAPAETPLDAAVRAAAKAIGRPLAPSGLPQRVSLDVPPHLLCRSGRDGQTKRYTYRVFLLRLTDPAPRHALGWHTVWMKRDDFLTHRPVSPSAVFIWEHLDENNLGLVLP